MPQEGEGHAVEDGPGDLPVRPEGVSDGTFAAPGPDEFDVFYAGYVSRVAAIPAPIAELTAQRRRMLDLLAGLTRDRAAYRYAPGKWSVADLVCHLSDAERIFACRLLRIARGDETPLPGWDENAYAEAAAAGDRPFRAVVDEWSAAREATATLAAGLPASAWARRGIANDRPVTARALLYIILGHVEHHRSVLEERYGLRRPA